MAHPTRLRELAVAAYLRGEGTRDDLARLFGVGRATIGRWVRAQRERGSVEKRPWRGGWKARIGPAEDVVLLARLREKPDLTLAELARALETERRVVADISQVHRALARLGVTRKKSRSGPASRIVPTSSPDAPTTASGPEACGPTISSSSTRRAPARR